MNQRENETRNLEAERAALERVDQEWAAAVSDGKDVDRIVSYWTDDAIVYAPGLPAIVGKQAIREFVEKSLATPGFSITWKTVEFKLSPDGNFAYGIGTNVSTFQDSEGRLVTLYGKGITVWRKESQAGWRCVVDIWNDDPAATG